MNTSFRVLFTLGAFVLINTAHAQQKKAQIDSLLQKASSLGIFNGNILVADQGKIIYQSSFGFADAAKQTKLTAQYRFHIGSIAKEFNAVAIMMLQERGKLSLDDKLSKFVNGLPQWADSISVKNLLQYASGLPDLKWNTIKGDADALATLKQVGKLDFKPGTRYAYNNSNTFFQRQIIQQITRMPFYRFVQDSMLKRLNMNSSMVDPTEKDPLVAKSFSKEGVEDPMAYPISGWTAVTIDDFYKWSQALNSFKLIKPASTYAIITPFVRDRQAGLGKGAMRSNQIETHVHDGSARNYQALLNVDNRKGRTIIWMSNSKNQQMFGISEAIQHILDGEPYVMPKRSVFELLQKKADSLDGAGIIRYYEELKPKLAAEYAFDNESELNNLGYYLMNKKRLDDAIVVFEYNTKLFPQSGNVFDSLGEAYYNKGDWKNSLLNYNTAVRLDPSNKGAREKIIELRSK